MEYQNITWDHITAKARMSFFQPGNGIKEYHVMIEQTDVLTKASEQFKRLNEAIQQLMLLPELQNMSMVWKRYFVSDAVNQAHCIRSSGNEAVSIVQQPPLNGTKVALWLYFAEDIAMITQPDETVVMNRPSYTHLFHTQQHERMGDVVFQTNQIFKRYIQSLENNQCSLKDHCVRTWIYVQDVDIQYAGMVNARKEHFEKAGMTSETHYIASTGIEGRYIYPEVLTVMDMYAIKEIRKEQVRFLKAPTHLNPTYEYGVTFERGTAIDYGDRRHIFISGTASINNKGEIVHPLDIESQILRTFDNIRALLAEADATTDDIAQMIIYLRDTADYEIVRRFMKINYDKIPQIITLAPVCRPGWLIEIECIALKSIKNTEFNVF